MRTPIIVAVIAACASLIGTVVTLIVAKTGEERSASWLEQSRPSPIGRLPPCAPSGLSLKIRLIPIYPDKALGMARKATKSVLGGEIRSSADGCSHRPNNFLKVQGRGNPYTIKARAGNVHDVATVWDSGRDSRRLQNVSKTPVDSRGLGKMPENKAVETSGWDSNL